MLTFEQIYDSIPFEDEQGNIIPHDKVAKEAAEKWDNTRWIPIDERLPEIMEYILCYAKGEVHSRLFSRGWASLSLQEFKSRCNVTHWRYMPKPPSL